MLAETLGIDRPHAFGLAVSIWCLCWREEFLDGRLKRWTAQTLADEILWKGDPKKMVEAMLDAEILMTDNDGETLVAKNFSKRQGPLIKKLLADRSAAEERARENQAKLQTPEQRTQTDEVNRHLIQQMKVSKIPGHPIQKRERIEAWRAQGITGERILEAIMNNPGKNVFEIEKLLTGANGKSAAKGSDSITAIRETFLKGGK